MTRAAFSQPRDAARNGRTAGFTLLELLIATSVSAIVLLVINATFFGALRLHNTTHEKIDRDLEVDRAISVIRRDLAGIMLPGGTLTGQLQTSALGVSSLDVVDGERITPDIHTSSGRVDGWTPFADVQVVSYFLTNGTNGSANKNLVRATTRNLLTDQDSVPEEQTLLTDVTEAAILFYDGAGWVDSWDSETSSTLPSAIKFSVVIARRDERASVSAVPPAPVEIVVPVMVMTSASAQEAAAAAAEAGGGG